MRLNYAARIYQRAHIEPQANRMPSSITSPCSPASQSLSALARLKAEETAASHRDDRRSPLLGRHMLNRPALRALAAAAQPPCARAR